MLQRYDFLDPNNLPVIEVQTISLSDKHDHLYCILDPIDYDWAKAYTWHAHFSNHAHECGRRIKVYACRFIHKNVRIYLHKEILERFAKPKTRRHSVGDHINGNSLDNRRFNLEWTTVKDNGHKMPRGTTWWWT